MAFKKISSKVQYRSPSAFLIATAVTGFAWVFGNQQVADFNDRQQQLITRTENDTEAQNCIVFPIKSSTSSIDTRLTTGTVRRLTSMECWERVDFSSSARGVSRRATLCWLPLSPTPSTIHSTTMKMKIRTLV